MEDLVYLDRGFVKILPEYLLQTYPTAQEDMVSLLARDCFVDALQDSHLQIYVKQAHPKNV
ncbi:hypothetical protein E2C01_077513 [Portunus trituberculatus]|uniref:Uncharacterized protein n=1 Tax=Portunus trituberculatus TaxID=210409 RepID=A0A5B7IMB0_PORTR|nr:hypothetical protein [Portunus trituberculatus]